MGGLFLFRSAARLLARSARHVSKHAGYAIPRRLRIVLYEVQRAARITPAA
jgi:hypothetical protein